MKAHFAKIIYFYNNKIDYLFLNINIYNKLKTLFIMDKINHSTKKLTTEEFIEKAKNVHGDKYDYSKVEYINSQTKVLIICPKHGEFLQWPQDHLKRCGCPKCKTEKLIERNTLTNEEFIKRAKKTHNDKYNYSKVNYTKNNEKVCIICQEHGGFWQTPNDHLDGCGCKKCSHANRAKILKSSTDEFIKKSKEIHGDKYDYSKVDYTNNRIKVCIICPKHGEFWQTPHSHLSGRGCPHCKSSQMEKEIEKTLKENNINYTLHERKLFKNKLELDFYIPEYNAAIECQGLQHFMPIKHFGGNEKFIERKNNDLLKKNICEQNNIHLIYYSNIKNIKFPYKVYNNKNDVLKEVKEWKKYMKS